MSGVKAKLKVVLQADETVVAESEDAVLWQRVLIAINTGDIKSLEPARGAPESARKNNAGQGMGGSGGANPDVGGGDGGDEGADELIVKFAKAVGATVEQVVGACSPSKTAPYLTLDMHCWNTLKDQTPARGRGSISPIAIAATLLVLWKQAAKLGNSTQAEVHKVLETINVRDNNAVRSISGADWLQGRTGGVVLVNPARIKRASAIARAFCVQDWQTDLSWKGSAAE